MSKYNEFLQEKIVSTEYNTVATFVEENGKVYIVDKDHKIPFDFFYKDELYSALLVAAMQLLNVTIMIEKSKEKVTAKISEDFSKESDAVPPVSEEHDDLD